MFCSTYLGCTKTYSIVKDVILNKDATIKDYSKFRITMFILKEFKIGYTGLTAILCGNRKIKTVVEIDAYPFGFVLELEPKEEIMACKEENNRKIEEINKQKIG